LDKKEFTIKSDLVLVKELIASFVRDLQRENFSKELIFDLRLAFEEALVNAVKHGNKGNQELSVRGSWSVSKERIEMVVHNEGEGFDCENVPDPTCQENIAKAGGRGFFLMKKLMDRVEFYDCGRKIKMIKFVGIS